MKTQAKFRIEPVWALAALAFLPALGRAETVTVPLSDPSRPAVVKTELVNGGITVEAWTGKEVVVEAVGREENGDRRRHAHSHGKGKSGDGDLDASIDEAVESAVQGALAGDDDGDRDARHDKADKSKGMHKIPNVGLGLSVEESQNVVKIESESWRRTIDLKIKVPANTALKLGCVNDGDIEVTGVTGDLELSNTNGSITVRAAGGTVVANTVNGEVNVTFAQLPNFKSMAFSSLNGDIDVTLPAAISADVRMSSDNGEIYSDFELKLAPKPSQVKEERGASGKFKVTIGKEVYGTIGNGGADLLFKTFNGNIYIRKGK
jgi:hypothetical protein